MYIRGGRGGAYLARTDGEAAGALATGATTVGAGAADGGLDANWL
jgi:hypothetical protein